MEAVTGIAIENPGGLVRSRRETNEFFRIFWSVKLPYITDFSGLRMIFCRFSKGARFSR